MPTAAQLYQSNPLTLTGSEYTFLQQTNGNYGGATAAQVANCVDQLFPTRTWMPRAQANGTALDVSGNALAVTLSLFNTSNSNSKQDPYCLVSTGANAVMTVASPGNAASFTGDLTLEGQFLMPSFNANMCLFDTRITSNTATSILIQSAGTSGQMNFYINGSAVLSSSANILANAWTHVALVRQGQLMTLYFNGVSVGSVGATTNLFTDGTIRVGNGVALGGSVVGMSIAGVRYSKFAQYSANFSPPTTPFPVIA